jgi:hypothetical protein
VIKITLQRSVAIAVTLALLLLVFELVRRKRLSERYAILWLLAASTLLVLAAWKGLLTTLSNDVGISYPPSALFALAIGLIAMILLHFSLAVSRLSDQNKVLAQRLGLLQQRVEEAEAKRSPQADDPLRAHADAEPPETRARVLSEREPPSPIAEELSSSR